MGQFRCGQDAGQTRPAGPRLGQAPQCLAFCVGPRKTGVRRGSGLQKAMAQQAHQRRAAIRHGGDLGQKIGHRQGLILRHAPTFGGDGFLADVLWRPRQQCATAAKPEPQRRKDHDQGHHGEPGSHARQHGATVARPVRLRRAVGRVQRQIAGEPFGIGRGDPVAAAPLGVLIGPRDVTVGRGNRVDDQGDGLVAGHIAAGRLRRTRRRHRGNRQNDGKTRNGAYRFRPGSHVHNITQRRRRWYRHPGGRDRTCSGPTFPSER